MMNFNKIGKCLAFGALVAMLGSCSIYRNYKRPEDLPAGDSLYRADGLQSPMASKVSGVNPSAPASASEDSLNFGALSWEELFTDPYLQDLIRLGLENNTDMQTAILRSDEAMSSLKAARQSFLPSLTLSPDISISKTYDKNLNSNGAAAKSYEIPLQASWEIDLFGSLRNAKQSTKATMLGQKAYQQAVRSNLIASIANSYYALLMLDEQIRISESTLDVWRENVRTMEAKLKVGDVTMNSVSQSKASLLGLEASYNELLRSQRETENSLCTLLGITPRAIGRGTLDGQTVPMDKINVGVPAYLLSHRPDVVYAEMSLASAYYQTNVARSAFYPKLTLSGSAGWTDGIGKAVANPGTFVLAAVASLAQPIYNRGKLISNLRVTKDEEQIALLNYKQKILDAGNEVNNALYAVQSIDRTLQAHEKQVEELETTVKSAEALYNTANATYLELLTARQSLLSAQLSVASDNLTRLQSVISLYNALGGGVE